MNTKKQAELMERLEHVFLTKERVDKLYYGLKELIDEYTYPSCFESKTYLLRNHTPTKAEKNMNTLAQIGLHCIQLARQEDITIKDIETVMDDRYNNVLSVSFKIELIK